MSDKAGEIRQLIGELVAVSVSLAFLVAAYLLLRPPSNWQLVGVIFLVWGVAGVVPGIINIARWWTVHRRD